MGKRSRGKKRFIYGVLISLAVVLVVAGLYVNNIFNNMMAEPDPDWDEDVGVTDDIEEDSEDDDSSGITNIALFGLDRRGTSGNSRSDSIMIATLDLNTDKIKLTSIMRDTYVNIPGRGMDKINHAYAFDGPKLAVQTINENFDLNIKDYAMVDFNGMTDIVDILGGVEIDVKSDEVSRTGVSSPGRQTLNGKQALAYSRIRYVGHGDFERTERQRRVLEEVASKIMNAGMLQYPRIVGALTPHVETSLSKGELAKLGTSVYGSDIDGVDQYRIPVDGYAQGQTIDGVYYLVPQSLEANVDLMHEFIYGE